MNTDYFEDRTGQNSAGLYTCGRWTWQLKDWYDKSVGLLVIGVGALHFARVLAAPDRHGDRGEY